MLVQEQFGDEEIEVVVQDEASAPPELLQPMRRSSSVVEPPTKANNRVRSRQPATRSLAAATPIKTTDSIATLPSSQSMSSGRSLPLLICSVGNPGSQFANTLHSAGHTVLTRLADRLGFPNFQKEKSYGNGLLSQSTTSSDSGAWTLWQSTSYMNVSGQGVRAAYMAWSRNLPDGEGRLVIVHDDLEKPLGAVSVKTTQGASAKGHNGLKSIMSLMGNTPFVRIGVGIGRPLSRASDDVASYVLKKMSPSEKTKIEGSIEEVLAKLKQLEKG